MYDIALDNPASTISLSLFHTLSPAIPGSPRHLSGPRGHRRQRSFDRVAVCHEVDRSGLLDVETSGNQHETDRGVVCVWVSAVVLPRLLVVAQPLDCLASGPVELVEVLTPFKRPAGTVTTSFSGFSIDVPEKRFAVKNMNDCAPFPFTSLKGDPANSFRIGDTTSLSPYEGGGLITETKRPKTLRFRSLGERLVAPGTPFGSDGLPMTDYTFSGKEAQVHAGLVGLMEFEASQKRLPNANDEQDAEDVLSAAKTYAAACQVLNTATADGAKALDVTIDESVVRAYARHASVELQPVATFAGGVVAQEVVKRSGKYTPIDGFAHFAFLETMPDPPPALADRAPRGDRYDDLAAVFGRSFVEKLGDLNYFLVGSGALGCEFVKNFALCGVCCGPEGSLTIADADRIELSNLTRQFLFREHNVGQSKALAAAAMATDPGGRTRASG